MHTHARGYRTPSRSLFLHTYPGTPLEKQRIYIDSVKAVRTKELKRRNARNFDEMEQLINGLAAVVSNPDPAKLGTTRRSKFLESAQSILSPDVTRQDLSPDALWLPGSLNPPANSTAIPSKTSQGEPDEARSETPQGQKRRLMFPSPSPNPETAQTPRRLVRFEDVPAGTDP